MARRSAFGFWTGLRLATAALLIWGGALLLFVDIDKLAAHW